nr:hypothetical protein [Thiobacillus thioparus]
MREEGDQCAIPPISMNSVRWAMHSGQGCSFSHATMMELAAAASAMPASAMASQRSGGGMRFIAG